jgi:predicted metal-dependent enzyme (double-stranded beta helix superfamily)
MFESVLSEGRRQVRDDRLLDLFEAREAGVTERAYLRLTSAAVRCEMWLIRWPAGSLAALHDHGPAYGVAQVLTGTLHELRFVDGVSAVQRRDWKPGAVIELARGICHEVRNISAQVAYSIHVYSPRLEQMTFYDRGARGELRALRQERSREWQPLTTIIE